MLTAAKGKPRIAAELAITINAVRRRSISVVDCSKFKTEAILGGCRGALQKAALGLAIVHTCLQYPAASKVLTFLGGAELC